MVKRIKDLESIIKNKKIKAFGVDIKLTEEQAKKFKKLLEPKYKNPYERVEKGEYYYTVATCITGDYVVHEYTETGSEYDDARFESGNYINNEEFAEQVAMGNNPQQKLRKFTYDNGWSEELWKDKYTLKYYIERELPDGIEIVFERFERFEIYDTSLLKGKCIYFSSYKIAERAICEIIIPFMEENPTFKW